MFFASQCEFVCIPFRRKDAGHVHIGRIVRAWVVWVEHIKNRRLHWGVWKEDGLVGQNLENKHDKINEY